MSLTVPGFSSSVTHRVAYGHLHSNASLRFKADSPSEQDQPARPPMRPLAQRLLGKLSDLGASASNTFQDALGLGQLVGDAIVAQVTGKMPDRRSDAEVESDRAREAAKNDAMAKTNLFVEQTLLPSLPAPLQKLPALGASDRLRLSRLPQNMQENPDQYGLPGKQGTITPYRLLRGLRHISQLFNNKSKPELVADNQKRGFPYLDLTKPVEITPEGDIVSEGKVTIPSADITYALRRGLNVGEETAANMRNWVVQAAAVKPDLLEGFLTTPLANGNVGLVKRPQPNSADTETAADS